MTSIHHLEEKKKTILHNIEALIAVAEHYPPKFRHSLQAQAVLLENLGSRIDLHHLPEGFIRSVINDARLDTLMIMTDLKVALTFQKQRLSTPSRLLPKETSAPHEIPSETAESGFGDGEENREDRLSVVADHLRALATIEQSLRMCMA